MKHKKTSLYRQILYMLSLVWKASPQKIIWQTIISLLQAVDSFVFSIIFIKYIVQTLEGNGRLLEILIISSLALMLKFIIALLNSRYSIKLSPLYNLQVSAYIQTILFNKSLSLDLAQYESKDFQEKYYKAISTAEGTAENVVNNSIQLFSNIIAVGIVLAYIFTIDPFLMTMILIPIITTFSSKVSNKVRYELNMKNLESQRKMNYVNRIVYLKEYALELRLSNIYKSLKELFQKASQSIKENYRNYGIKLSFLRMVTDFLLTTFTLLFSYLYIGWRYIYRKDILFSDFTVLVSAVNNLNGKVNNLLNNIYALQDNALYINNIQDFLAEEPLISKNESGLTVPDNDNMQFVFDHVSFKYDKSNENTLKDINITINQNEKIAIVGKNGSGKSTLIKLLMRLYDVTDGTISINHADIKKINLENYRALFTVVFQDFKLFATSIEENITLGNDVKENVVQAMKYMEIFDKFNTMKYGLNTQLSKEFDDEGVVLSGGQSQKLAVTRAFASNAKIIILDEPTASLDPESEHLLYENIYEHMKEKTVIFVSHRLTSTIMADKIIMMDSGQIRECGTHEELMALKGSYYELFQIQAASYREVSK